MNILNQNEREFGLTTGLEARFVLGPVLGQSLHHHAALINLDGIHALITTLVISFFDSSLKGRVQLVQAVLDNLRKAQK